MRLTAMNGYADFHIHSKESDGTLTPDEIAKEAKRLGLVAFAISDHDTIKGILDVKNCVPAIELGTNFDGKDIHILGYLINTTDEKLLREIDKQRINRMRRMEYTLDVAEKEGIYVTMDDVKRFAEGESIGRPHIARAIMEKEGMKITENSFHNFFKDNFNEGGKFYVKREKMGTSKAIETIRGANGIAVLAHPGKTKNDEIIPYLVKEGLEGLEVYYPSHDAAAVERYKAIAIANDLLMTGGSDSHGPNTPIGCANAPAEIYEKMLMRKEGL